MPSAEDLIDLHELAKGWKAAIARAKDPATRHEAQVKNDRGNLPLHSCASFRAPIEVTEALLEAYPEAASVANNYGNLALHFTAWKKGPLDVEKLLLKVNPDGAAQKNNHGNLPLHYAAHYNAPLEVVEALYHAYPEGAMQKNNDNNTPLDLAIADGASPNVVALLQGQSVPPTDDEVLESAKSSCERLEKEIQRAMEQEDGMSEEREIVLRMLMEIKASHPHALYSAGIDPTAVTDMDSLLDQVRKASAVETTPPGITDEEIEAQIIEDSLCPPDDPVESALGHLVGIESVKNQIRGLRRTAEMEAEKGTSATVLRHLAFVGNQGTGKATVARLLPDVLFDIGVIKSSNFVEVGREDLIDCKSEARTVFKTRKAIERANGGVLFVNEAYTLLPSTARPRGRDHGAAALRELARALPADNTFMIMAGAPLDLQRILSSDIGFKGHFLTRIEFPDPTPEQIARIFMSKLSEKGLVPAEGVTVEYMSELIETNTDPDWRIERNGIISELLMAGVRAEIKKRCSWDDVASKGTLSPIKILSPGTARMPAFAPDEVFVTVEDVQNAIVNAM